MLPAWRKWVHTGAQADPWGPSIKGREAALPLHPLAGQRSRRAALFATLGTGYFDVQERDSFLWTFPCVRVLMSRQFEKGILVRPRTGCTAARCVCEQAW